LRSAAFWTVFFFSTIGYAVLILVLFPFPRGVRFRLVGQWTRLNLWWLERSCALSFHTTGLENVPPGNAIVFSKHQSTWETIALQTIFKPQSWVIKRELLWVPFFGWAMALMEPIAINRGAGRSAVQQLVSEGTERLKQGRWIIVFPEGTRVPAGAKGRYRIGGAVLAEKSGYPIIPVAHNAGEYWPRRGFIKRPGTIQLRIGKPIGSRGKTAQQLLEETEAWIEGTMREITAARQEAPAVAS
jgi:1-acyl-sn-glycerol-3-phosphate acyltransferase